MDRYHVTQKGGARHSAACPALASSGPSRLEARTGAHITRILLEGKKAVGVEYLEGTETRQVMAGKGVILAAGAVTSPHPLMLSGAGERAQLEAGVEVLLDLPGVGQNLQDHLFVPVVCDTETPGLKDATGETQMTPVHVRAARHAVQKRGRDRWLHENSLLAARPGPLVSQRRGAVRGPRICRAGRSPFDLFPGREALPARAAGAMAVSAD
ncbi:hypothetical protein GCM10010840_06970 [Deinococcus aerolatus]|uniref:Glucose-methanol-choline oxidoreductase N-terminal domain-containing protein n=1 Tax=Deinococcus aerolatus TaxID=522487 RepID=A0ABQ2G267_9DEIO|nr:hypothetical protein GCM10010840_06970 [Deinococcus aerolatus]